MKNRDVYKIWAPQGAKWVDWVRPVPFVELGEYSKEYAFSNFKIPQIFYTDTYANDIAIIVDLPGYESIEDGIALAKLGYRPIPVFNGTNEQKGAMATTDNHAVEFGLIYGATELNKIEISKDAQPVFLLDTNRLNRYKMNASVFDNSWDVYDQDMPSAEYFLKNGINKIIVRSKKVEKDLSKILYKYQQKGITIMHTQGFDKPERIKIKKPAKKDMAL